MATFVWAAVGFLALEVFSALILLSVGTGTRTPGRLVFGLVLNVSMLIWASCLLAKA